MTTNFYPGNLSWIGLAKETTYGTPVAAPTIWVPCDTPKWNPKVTPLKDQALRGMMGMTYQQQQGMRYDEVTYKTYAYLDTVFPHLLAFFGNPDTLSGGGDPYTHKTALYNGTGSDGAQPVSYTGFVWQPSGKVEQVPGMQIVDLKIDIKADQLVSIDVTWNGLPSTAITAPTNTPTTKKPMPSWSASVTIGGVGQTKYTDIALEYKRGTKPIPALTGSQSPVAIYAGEASCTAQFDAVYQGTTDIDLVNYLTNVQPALSVSLFAPGDSSHTLTLQHSVCAYDSASATANNSGWMTIQSQVECLMNSTDALDSKMSPGQAILLSPQSTAF